mmetsp:Transcript_848/g.1939  ORF Transcript_848/g.1939 Transcript_848/m.1939 type:complete len:211 (-) Transcript_848:40-672(-)
MALPSSPTSSKDKKTGWYYDHRDHRSLLASLAAQAPRVLDVYSYTGGFGVTLAQYGAERVVCVDSSAAALELCSRAATMNAVGARVEVVRSDAIEYLERASRGEDVFDLVIVDPPNLGTERVNAPRALRYYERLICAAAGVCASPGMLFVACCTYHVGPAELIDAANRALHWAGRPVARIVATGGQAADHPGHPALPESRYLRSFLIHLE